MQLISGSNVSPILAQQTDRVGRPSPTGSVHTSSRMEAPPVSDTNSFSVSPFDLTRLRLTADTPFLTSYQQVSWSFTSFQTVVSEAAKTQRSVV